MFWRHYCAGNYWNAGRFLHSISAMHRCFVFFLFFFNKLIGFVGPFCSYQAVFVLRFRTWNYWQWIPYFWHVKVGLCVVKVKTSSKTWSPAVCHLNAHTGNIPYQPKPRKDCILHQEKTTPAEKTFIKCHFSGADTSKPSQNSLLSAAVLQLQRSATIQVVTWHFGEYLQSLPSLE